MNHFNHYRGSEVHDVEFELSTEQFSLMGAVNLQQGHSLDLTLETSVLLPEPAGESWFAVQAEALSSKFVRISPGTYAFSGQIQEAELVKEDGQEIGFLLVHCENVPLRVIVGPDDEGRLPWGTWETRYLTGISRIFGIVEDNFSTSIGRTIGATVWQISRLILNPGDPLFGQWHESADLPLSTYSHDKIFVMTRLHRQEI
ncbi:MAG: hypothetical protein AAF702_31395 [Chloroflexota bacterium]